MTIEKRPFGRTGHMSSAVIFGSTALKAVDQGPWAAGTAPNRETWYQPLEDEGDIRAVVHWVLARPRLFLNSVGDVNLLPLVLQAADELGPMLDHAAMAKLNDRAGLTSIFGL
jgi:hypothetical protein